MLNVAGYDIYNFRFVVKLYFLTSGDVLPVYRFIAFLPTGSDKKHQHPTGGIY